MRVIIIGREFSDYNREVREWTREFKERTKIEVEELDPDSGEGEDFCRSRDIVEYPTLVIEDEARGTVLAEFRGTPLPQIDEVMSYLLN